MKDNELKENIRKNIKEKIAISNIREEFDMKTNKNKKMIYTMTSACAMFILCIGVFIGVKNFDNNVFQHDKSGIANLDKQSKEESLEIKLNINKIKDMELAKLDADVEIIDIVKLDEKFSFTKNFVIPEEYKLKTTYNLYTRKDKTSEYNILHDHVIHYEKDELNNIIISFSEIEEPIRDYDIQEKKISKIGDVNLIISQLNDMYIASFNCKEIYFDIETKGITENELLTLLESIINSVRNVKNNKIEEKDANVNEQTIDTMEKTSYPNYYAGKYIDDKGNNVVLLYEDNSKNRKEICIILGISETKTIFKKAEYTYEYLTELQNKISKKMQNKEFPFVISSSLMEDSNNIKVIVTSNDINDWNKIKELDTIGGAVDIEYSTNSNAKEDLLIELE